MSENDRLTATDSLPWSASAYPIWANGSGYEHAPRVGKPLALLQAFADDSASDSGDRRLFYAGYVNRADKWALFSDAWAEELKAEPSIRHLHMVEANNLRGEFRGWSHSARDEKLRGLARVIRHFKPISFEFSVSRREHDELLRPVSPRPLGNAHFSCVFGVTSLVSRFIHENKVGIPIDFIFDEQDSVSADFQFMFPEMIKSMPRGARQLINGLPIFRNDRDFLPLQAADMLAWHIRREHEEFGEMGKLQMANLLRSNDAHVVSCIETSHLSDWNEKMAKYPELKGIQEKSHWRKFRPVMQAALDSGFIPPMGTRWKNAIYRLRELFTHLVHS